MLLVIDNFDSFTFNLVHYFEALGEEVRVYRNDSLSIAVIEAMNPDRIVISPGPGTPADAGISIEVIKHFYKDKPILGVCLGHQSIAESFGGEVVRANRLVHGKTSSISHKGTGLFAGLPQDFQATRYHSLAVDPESLPDFVMVTAWTTCDDSPEVMGLQHRDYPLVGVQFHPEAFLTEHGHALLQNFIDMRIER